MKMQNHNRKKSIHHIRSGMVFATFFTALFFISTTTFGQGRFGINLTAVGANSTEFVYKDLCKAMVGQRAGSGFVESQFDANGYPKYLNAGQSVTLAYGSGTNQLWPTGDYHIFFDGVGTIAEVTGSASLKQDLGNGHQIWTVIHGGSDFLKFAITATNTSNYLKNLRIIMPGFESNYQTDPIHPTYREHWGMFSAFRFMDWTGTNGSPIVNYTNVMPAGYISQVGYSGTWGDATFPSDPHGNSPEMAAELCNLMNKDMWICMPHQASDACMQQIAQLIKNKLNSNLKVYLEYSNEVWNWAFQQATYCKNKGIELGLTTGGSMEYYTYRSGQMYKIWEDVWGTDKSRVINVFAWQTTTANPDTWINKAINEWFYSAQFNPAGAHPEFYANAPYIWDQSVNTPSSVDELFAGATEDINHDKVIMSSQKSFADANGLEYGCYESGQHYSSYATNEPLDLAVYVPANRDPRMKTMYLDYHNYWKNNIGGLMMVYSSCGPYSKYGSWGIIERYNQDMATAYKYQAISEVIAGSGSPDTQAPTTPSNLSSSNRAQTSFTLSWTASTDNVGVTGYEVFKNGVSIGTSASTSMNVTGLTAGTQYSMTVRARDAAANWSAQSSALAVTTTTGGTTTQYEAESAALSGGAGVWSDHTGFTGTGFVGFPSQGATLTFTVNAASAGSQTVVVRYAGSSPTKTMSLYLNGSKVKQLSMSTSGWDTWNTVTETLTLNAGNNTIAIKWDSGDTGGVNVDNITVTGSAPADTQAPTAPTALSSGSINQTSFTLSWAASTDNVGVTSYEVFAGSTSKGTTSSTSLSITGLTCATAYSMTVKAKDAAGNVSAASSALNVTTSACSGSSTKYEAENGTLSGGAGIWTNTAGYSGTGFVGFPSQGATVTITVNAPSAGSYNVAATYTVGGAGGSSHLMSLYLNGSKVKQLSMPTPGGWVSVTEALTLNAGNNTIAIKWDAGDNGGINLDFITVTSNGSSDTQAPTAPTGLVSSVINQNSFILSWTASTDNVGVTSYEVFAGSTSKGTTSSTSLSISGLTCSTTYSMTVKARDAAGNVSTASSALNVTTSACGSAKLSGTVIGTPGSWSGTSSDDRSKAFDGNTATFFDAPVGDGAWTGLDLSSTYELSKVRFYPRSGFASRMTGGKFQGSNTADFSSMVTDLATISSQPANNAWTEIAITNTTPFRYVRYLSPNSGWGNVAEIEFYNLLKSASVTVDLSSLPSAPAITIYPNPAKDVVNIKLVANNHATALIQVFSMDGKQVLNITEMADYGENVYRLSVGELEAGVYFISIKTADKTYTNKILIQHK